MIFHLVSIGNKCLWSLAHWSFTVLAEGESQQVVPVPANRALDNESTADNTAVYPTTQDPAINLWHKDASGRSMVCAVMIQQSCCWGLPELDISDAGAEQPQRPQSQQTHIPAPGKPVRFKHQLQPCKSKPTRNLQHEEHLELLALFHLRTPASTIGGFTKGCNDGPGGNNEDQPLALYQFDIDVHLWQTLSKRHDKILSSLITDKRILHFSFLSWYPQQLSFQLKN